MKNIIMSIAGTLMLLGSAVTAQSKVGYVDSQKLLGSLKETQAVQTQMQAEQEKMYAQFQYLQDSLANSQEDYVKNVKDNPLLKDGAKKAIEKGIQELAYLVQSSQQKFQEELYAKQQELMKPILDKIKKAVDNVRKAEGLDIMLDSAYGIILASDTKLDLTQKTIDELVKMATEKDSGTKK
ncbi:OmpH family outer membrane protein [bacterium]|nr:OmpH family outer membrane protein [bacterium]